MCIIKNKGRNEKMEEKQQRTTRARRNTRAQSNNTVQRNTRNSVRTQNNSERYTMMYRFFCHACFHYPRCWGCFRTRLGHDSYAIGARQLRDWGCTLTRLGMYFRRVQKKERRVPCWWFSTLYSRFFIDICSNYPFMLRSSSSLLWVVSI